jgi:hypothetical protein
MHTPGLIAISPEAGEGWWYAAAGESLRVHTTDHLTVPEPEQTEKPKTTQK